MPVQQNVVTVEDTVTSLFNASHNRRRFYVHLPSDAGGEVEVGGASLLWGQGVRLALGETFEVVQNFPTDASAKYQWYAVTNSGGSVDVRVVEVTG